MNVTKETRARPLFDAEIVRRAVADSFRKLDPRVQVRNPVMFVVWSGALLTSALALQAVVGRGEAPFAFVAAIALWLWATVLFASFASGLPPTLIRMIRDRAPQGMEARTLAYGTSIQQMGSALAPLIAGVLTPYLGLHGFFWVCSAMLIVGWVLWRKSRRADGARDDP